jgi:hypothetical protein
MIIEQLPARRAKAQRFFANQIQHSFEVVFAFFCIYSGIVSLFNFGIVSNAVYDTLGPVVGLVFNVLFIISGFAIYLGVGVGRGNVEAAGLILLAVSLFVRSVAAGWVIGFSPLTFNAYVLNGAFICSCVVRLALLIKAQQMLEKHGL